MEKTLRLMPCCLKASAIPREKDATCLPCYSVNCVSVGERGGGGGSAKQMPYKALNLLVL